MDQVAGLKVIEPGNDLFRKAVSHGTDYSIKQSVRYDDDVVHERHRMAKKTTTEIMYRMF